MKVLITGILGFAGSHLCEHLLAQRAEVCGARFPGELNLLPDEAARQVELFPCDLRERNQCDELIDRTQPEVIFHLAAIAFVPQARQDPATAFDTNVTGSVNLMEATRRRCPGATLVVISSGEVYGKVSPQEVPTSEEAAIRPASFYAATKAAVEMIAAAYGAEYGLRVVILRPFSHIGPRQSPAFVTASFARQIAQIEKGRAEPVMSVGNLEAQRDFTDVRDMVRAYALASEKCEPGQPYNIASGTVHHIQEALDVLLSLTQAKVTVRQDPALLRPSDTPIFQGDATRFRQRTDWEPTIPFRQSLEDTLNYWRGQL